MCAILRQLKGLFDIADFTPSHLRDGAKKSLISAVITYKYEKYRYRVVEGTTSTVGYGFHIRYFTPKPPHFVKVFFIPWSAVCPSI